MQKPARKTEFYRILEIAIIGIFIAATLILMLGRPAQSSAALPAQESPLLMAIASAMPNQGWAPMTVYFSAYGSHTTDSTRIVRYEWDLDGNGLFDTDATAQGGYAQYTYSKPGIYTATLRVTDEQGRFATESMEINVRHPGSSPVNYWEVFDDSQVRRVDISLTKANWDLMWLDIEAKTEVPADAVIFGEQLNNIGFRMRGQFSMRESGLKKPWKINTDAYIEGQEFHNLRQLMFINQIGDLTMQKEKLAYDMLHFAGVPASHVCHVELWIDFTDDELPPDFYGIYSMIERVDKKFLSSRFGRDGKDGNLYKASHAQRGPMDLIYYGDRIEDYPTQDGLYAYGKASNEEENDYSDIINLIQVIDGVQYATPEDFALSLEEVFNVDGFLRYMAVVMAIGNWDSYPYTGNNFYLFNDSVSGKFEWIPWDLAWGEDARFPIFEREMGMVSSAPLYDRVFEVKRYRLQYAAYMDLILRYWFNEQNITNQAKMRYAMIAPYVTQGNGDKMYFDETGWFEYQAFVDSWQELAAYTRQRNAFIRQELDKELEQY